MPLYSTLRSLKIKPAIWVFLWLVFTVAIMGFVHKRQSERMCKKINIHIFNEYNNYFVNQEDVTELITQGGKHTIVNNIHAHISLKKIEELASSHGFIQKSVVYNDFSGQLYVKIVQHQPLLRLILPNGNGKYVSEEGTILPLSPRFTPRLLLLDGNYNAILAQKNWNKDTLRTPYLHLFKKISKDEFLKTMLAAAHINYKGEVIFYPQIGKQVIEFGQPHDVDKKLEAVKAFYKKIIPYKGWNRYKRVNLEYENQMICE